MFSLMAKIQDETRLIPVLSQEVEQGESRLIEPGQSYPIWSPDRAFAAAAAVLQVLEDEEG